MKVLVSFLFLCLWAISGHLFADTTIVLKEKAAVTNSFVFLKDLTDGTITNNLSFKIDKDRFYSNQEISMAFGKSIKDLVFVGSGVWIERQIEIPSHQEAVLTNVPEKTEAKEGLYLGKVQKNSAELIYQKGGISVVSPIRIVRKLEKGAYLVENKNSGKIFKIRIDEDATSE